MFRREKKNPNQADQANQANQAKIFALVGTLGSGKTSSILPLVQALQARDVRPEAIAVIMIDTAGVGMMYSEISRRVRLEVLPNGCFTCGDPKEVRDRVVTLERAGIRHIILEGFGVISGDEIAAALAQLGRPCDIIACLDGRQYYRNCCLGLRALIRSHVAVATLGVLVTKTTSPSKNLVALLEKCGGGRRWSASAAASFPEAWQGDLWRRRPLPRFAAVAVEEMRQSGASIGVHGWPDIAFRLRAGVTIPALKKAFGSDIVLGALSLKGVVAGTEFRAVPGARTWEEKASTAESNVVVVYLRPGTSERTIAPHYGLFEERLSRSYELIRSGAGDPKAVAGFLQRFVSGSQEKEPAVSGVGQNKLSLVTHPEAWQLAKELARRKAFQQEWFLPVMKCFIQYWVRCQRLLVEREGDFDTEFLATHRRELGVSLAWWAHCFAVDLPEPDLRAVYSAKPAYLVARGIVALEALRSDDFWRYWQALEYLRALGFGLDYLMEEEKAVVEVARQCVFRLARSPEEAQVWRRWFTENQ
jgi:hypothetical protein